MRIRTIGILAIVTVLVLGVAGVGFAVDADFVDYANNPVVDPETTRAYYPDVLYSATGFDGHGAASPYKMWYDSDGSIWLAYSDDGFEWDILETPVLVGMRHPQLQYDASAFGDEAGDLIQASFPETYTVDPYYKMWAWEVTGDIYFAYSDDGITWYENYAREALPSSKFPVWSSAPVYDLEVLYYGGTYYGWADNNGRLYNCTSSDGTTWTVGTDAILPSADEWDSVNHSRAAVVRVSDTEWHMWFGGTSNSGGGGNWGIGHATSTDGVTWVKDSPNIPVQSLGGYGVFGGLGDTGTWNENRNYAPTVIYDADLFDGNGEAAAFKMWRSGKNDATGEYTIGVTGVEPPITTTYHPIEGTSRFETAVEASKEAFPGGSDVVLIATARNWPDALGGSALAGAYDCPILLVDTHSVPPTVTAEITRLGATRAVILGGESAVGPEVATELAKTLTVTRIGGQSRYETAELIAAEVIAELDVAYDGTAFVATGAKFPDALAASPLAFSNGWPIYLVSPNEGAPIAVMDADGVTDVLILGGEAAVSVAHGEAIMTAFGISAVERIEGGDRYATATAVATYGTANAGMGWDWMAIATGENFPDALAGGVVPARKGAVLVLTRTNSLPLLVEQTLLLHREEIEDLYFLGGTAAVSDDVREQVAAQLR